MDMLRRANPELHKKIEDARAENPEAADRILQRVAPHMRELMAERDQEMLRLRIESMRNGWEIMGAMRDLGDTIRSEAPPEELDAARTRLAGLLGSHFDLQVKLHEREISVLEDRLAQLRKEMDEQSSGKESFVQQKLDQAVNAIRDRVEREKKGEAPPRRGPGRDRGERPSERTAAPGTKKP
jgi:hypothetical protein